jgi:signal transduction histidine kinase
VGPWIAAVMRDRSEERRRRLQADARSDMAAHLHDSVLQTLALIQRTDDPRVISQLARQQERELRRWLYADSDDPSATTLKHAIERIGGVVEDRFDVTVETVVVGEAAMDTSLEALVGAAGEAATNAAKWSGCAQISLYAEVDDDGVRVFVRDTGTGFDTASVAEDRLGVRESIIGRMERVGGSADIRSANGQGTEVELFVPTVAAIRRDTV